MMVNTIRKGVVDIILGYVRVSTVLQNEARQLVTMEEFNVEKVFQEKISAKDANRPKLQELLEFARENDKIVVHDFSRLARNTKNLLEIVDDLNSRNITLVSKKENLDTSTPTGKLLLTVIAAINTFELENNRERMLEGVAIAKKQGKYNGRKSIQIEDFEIWYDKWKNREYSKSQLAKELGISRQTLYRLFDEYERTHHAD